MTCQNSLPTGSIEGVGKKQESRWNSSDLLYAFYLPFILSSIFYNLFRNVQRVLSG